MKKFRIDFKTISGRFILLAGLFLIVTILLTLIIIAQSQRAESALTTIKQVRVPVPLLASSIIGNIDRVASLQRAYMLSGNNNYPIERAKVYKEDLYPSLAMLIEVRASLSDSQRQLIDQTSAKVKEFESVQEEILSFFESRMLPSMVQINSASVEELPTLTSAFILKVNAEKEISTRIKFADTLRAELLVLVTSLRDSQAQQLTQEISDVNHGITRSKIIVIVLSVSVCILLAFLTYITIGSLQNSIAKPVKLINQLALGDLPDGIETSQDELNEILLAGKQLTDNMKYASKFAMAIGEGKLDHDYKVVSENDVLGKSLLHMRDRLQIVAQEEQRRNWAISGIAELGNILRTQTENTDTFYDAILLFVVKYLKANQGTLYLVNKTAKETTLELVACYAFNKKKYIHQTIQAGQGLVGQVFLEKEHVFLKEVPADYIHITSGLGDAAPRCIVIYPMLLNEEVFGIVEIASFSILAPHEMDFLKRASDQIASVIASVQSNNRTAKLLEASQQQEEELRSQEEEMRQNMEELSATQEEMSRKEKEYIRKIEALQTQH